MKTMILALLASAAVAAPAHAKSADVSLAMASFAAAHRAPDAAHLEARLQARFAERLKRHASHNHSDEHEDGCDGCADCDKGRHEDCEDCDHCVKCESECCGGEAKVCDPSKKKAKSHG